MNYDNFSFKIKDENGDEFINDIICVVPNDKIKDEPYVVFTDYTLDSNDEFIEKFGRLEKNNEEFYLNTKLNVFEMDYIEKKREDDIVKYVNDGFMENLDV